jgi:outer membrane protein
MRAAFGIAFALVLSVDHVLWAQTLPVTFQPSPQQEPVPRWARVAFFDPARVASQSSLGKAAAEALEALRRKRAEEADERRKTLRAEQEKLERGGGVLSEMARADIARKVDRFQIDLQRFLEDARAELAATEQRLTEDFRRKLAPALDRVAKERRVDLIFSRSDSGLAWADPAFDISDEIVKQLDRPDPPK